MKILFLTITILSILLIPRLVWSQVCREVKITDQQQHLTLIRFFDECRREKYFVGDKGVVLLTRSTDYLGRLVWTLEATIDDRYLDNPPTLWASFNGEITLIYNSEKPSSSLTESQKIELKSCLKKVIKDRLYIRPPKEEIWYDVEEKPGVPVLNADTGKPMRSRRIRLMGGNPSNHKKIIFNQDGTQTVLKSV